jgi:1,2-phenylacetyl-CoA epoxidase PaaB subunit
MNPTSAKGGTSWLRDFIENSAAVVAVMAPEIKHGLRVARNAISSRAEGIMAWQARERAASAKQ